MLWIFSSKSRPPPLPSMVPSTPNTFTPFSYFVYLLHLRFCFKSLLKNYAWREACWRHALEKEIIKLLFEEELARNYCLKKSVLETIVWRRVCWRIMFKKGACWRPVLEKEVINFYLNKSLLARDYCLKRSLLKIIKSWI